MSTNNNFVVTFCDVLCIPREQEDGTLINYPTLSLYLSGKSWHADYHEIIDMNRYNYPI